MEPIEQSDLDLEKKLLHPGGDAVSRVNESEKIFQVEKESPMEVVGAEKDDSYSQVLSKIQATPTSDEDQSQIVSDAEKVKEIDPQSHVQHLVDIALQKGVVHAVKVAKHMDDNYVLDTFHDRLLTEQLHEELTKKGMMREL